MLPLISFVLLTKNRGQGYCRTPGGNTPLSQRSHRCAARRWRGTIKSYILVVPASLTEDGVKDNFLRLYFVIPTKWILVKRTVSFPSESEPHIRPPLRSSVCGSNSRAFFSVSCHFCYIIMKMKRIHFDIQCNLNLLIPPLTIFDVLNLMTMVNQTEGKEN